MARNKNKQSKRHKISKQKKETEEDEQEEEKRLWERGSVDIDGEDKGN